MDLEKFVEDLVKADAMKESMHRRPSALPPSPETPRFRGFDKHRVLSSSPAMNVKQGLSGMHASVKVLDLALVEANGKTVSQSPCKIMPGKYVTLNYQSIALSSLSLIRTPEYTDRGLSQDLALWDHFCPGQFPIFSANFVLF